MVYISSNKNPPTLEEQILGEFIQEKEEKTCLGTSCQCCGPAGCYERRCVFMGYWMGGLCTLGGVVTLIVLSLVLVKPYTDTLNYRETTCFVTKSEYDTKRMDCACGKTCKSRYPCLEIYVNYTRYDNNQVSTLLREDENFGECSYYPGCERNEDVNALRVKEHQDKYGSGNYSCLYDVTVGSNKVIRVRKLGQDGMVHCLLWPSLVIVVSVVFIIMMIHACGCKYVCACPLPQDVKEAAAARRGMSGNGVQMHSIRTVYFQEPSLSY